MITQPEFVIIGAGITGLYTAYNLIEKQGIEGKRICIFNENSNLFSRLNSYSNSMGQICELGAARFNRLYHPLLVELIERFELELVPFKYKNCYNHLSGLFDKEELNKLFDHPCPSSESFFSYACSVFGIAKANLLCSLTGYYALRSPRMSVSTALQIIQTHPESFLINESNNQWYSLSYGFKQLVDCLVQFLKNANVQFFSSFKINKMNQEKEGWINLKFLKDKCEYLDIRTKKCFLALPFTKIKDISMPWKHLDHLFNHIVNVPLFKCFLGYENSWWDDEIDGLCFITENECQKIYVNSRKNSIFFYCDSENAEFWHDLMKSNTEAFLNQVHHKIRIGIGRPVLKLEKHKTCVAKFWPIGVSFWDKDWHGNFEGYSQLTENIYLCSDVFTDKNGWIEGGLLSSKYACSSILASNIAEEKLLCSPTV